MGHVTEDAEYHEPGQKAREAVYAAREYRVPITIVVEFVVGAQGQKGPEPRPEGKKYLGRRVDPHLKHIKSFFSSFSFAFNPR